MRTTVDVIKCDGCHQIIKDFYEKENRIEIEGQFHITTTGKQNKNKHNTKKVYSYLNGVNVNLCSRDCLIKYFKV